MKFFLSALALAFAAYVVVQANGFNSNSATAGAGVPKSSANVRPAKPQCPNPLAAGQKSSQVTVLQRGLNKKGISVNVDGAYGSDTTKAVLDFQRQNNIKATGKVDSTTWKALGRC